jgi:hypothetical protein
MEYAIRIISPTEEKLVSIAQMQELGEKVARDYTYECPDNDCRVTVYPSFPQRIKPGRIKAPRPYFSARSKSHEEICQGDHPFVLDKEIRRQLQTRTFTPKAEALLANYPIKFNESEHKERRETSEAGDALGDVSLPTTSAGGGVRGSGERSERTRVSVRSSSHVSQFVRVYEGVPEERSHIPIKIEGCPAKTYAEAFLHVSKAVDAHGAVALRHIYWGNYDQQRPRKTGTVIYFKGTSGNGKPLTVWVPYGISKYTFTEEIMKRLDRASRDLNAKIYVLGRFKFWEGWKYTIDLTTLNHLWVSYPDDK